MGQWKYYNHAMIPDIEPHENVDVRSIVDKTIWKNNKAALFARWTSNFDCGYETNWWYIIKDGPFDIQTLDKKVRKHIRQAQKQVEVRLIRPEQYTKELADIHNRACASYEAFHGSYINEDTFKAQKEQHLDFWGAFEWTTGHLIGYMSCRRFKEHVETVTAKYDPQMLHLRPSDAIHAQILEYYLNELKYPYVCSGSRNINHTTNVQEYKIKTFGFRKAYCKLHMEFRPGIRLLVPILRVFRALFKHLDKNRWIHLINAVLDMDAFAHER